MENKNANKCHFFMIICKNIVLAELHFALKRKVFVQKMGTGIIVCSSPLE